MTNRNYSTPTVDEQWADKRDTSMAVAVAIHAISDDKRSAQQIWEAPTQNEWDHVCMAVQEYVDQGDFDADESGYAWGEETVPHFSGVEQ